MRASSTELTGASRSINGSGAHGAVASHSRWTVLLHWSSVLAVVIATAAAFGRDATENTLLRNVLMETHRQAGLFVLLALGLRLAVRFTAGMADHAKDLPTLVRVAALCAHIALYAVLLILPALGWAGTNAHGVTMKLFGVLPLPNLVADDPDLADELTDYHVWAAWALLALVVAHVAAAWWHHVVRRDGVLVAMAPWLKRRRSR